MSSSKDLEHNGGGSLIGDEKQSKKDATEPKETSIFKEYLNDHCLCVHHLKYCVDSTQDEAKRMLQDGISSNSEGSSSHFVVIADAQNRGRGTAGRTWEASPSSTPGNLFLTYCLPMDDIPMKQLTLLPLSIGVLVAESLQNYVESPSLVTVKWPNDVLLDQKKVAGTLIENCAVAGTAAARNTTCSANNQYWLLIGVGVNLAWHPTKLPTEHDAQAPAREATCLQKYLSSPPEAVTSASPTTAATRGLPSNIDFGVDLSKRIQELTVVGELGRNNAGGGDDDNGGISALPMSTASIIQRWRSLATPMGGTYVLRQTGESVTTVDVESDGQLRVKGVDGKERLLVTDYFV